MNCICRQILEDGQAARVALLVCRLLTLCIGIIPSNDHTYWSSIGIHTPKFVMMLFAHATQNSLLLAILNRTQLLFGTMSDTPSALHCNFIATISFASFSCWAVCTAQASLLDILVAPWVLAGLAFGPMRNAQASLHHSIGTIRHGTLASNSLARSPCSQLLHAATIRSS